jgi:hypothetical protein
MMTIKLKMKTPFLIFSFFLTIFSVSVLQVEAQNQPLIASNPYTESCWVETNIPVCGCAPDCFTTYAYDMANCCAASYSCQQQTIYNSCVNAPYSYYPTPPSPTPPTSPNNGTTFCKDFLGPNFPVNNLNDLSFKQTLFAPTACYTTNNCNVDVNGVPAHSGANSPCNTNLFPYMFEAWANDTTLYSQCDEKTYYTPQEVPLTYTETSYLLLGNAARVCCIGDYPNNDGTCKSTGAATPSLGASWDDGQTTKIIQLQPGQTSITVPFSFFNNGEAGSTVHVTDCDKISTDGIIKANNISFTPETNCDAYLTK